MKLFNREQQIKDQEEIEQYLNENPQLSKIVKKLHNEQVLTDAWLIIIQLGLMCLTLSIWLYITSQSTIEDFKFWIQVCAVIFVLSLHWAYLLKWILDKIYKSPMFIRGCK